MNNGGKVWIGGGCLVVALVVALWALSGDPETRDAALHPSDSGDFASEPGTDSHGVPRASLRAREPGNSSTDALVLADALKAGAWVFDGHLVNVSDRPQAVRVRAHWWQAADPAVGATPDRVFDTVELTVGDVRMPFRLVGKGAGVVRLFIHGPTGMEPATSGTRMALHPVVPRRFTDLQDIYVGGHRLEGRAVDSDGKGVPSRTLRVHDVRSGQSHVVTTDNGGRFAVHGLHGVRVVVSHSGGGSWSQPPRYATFRGVEVQVGKDPVVVRMPRNPVVRFRVEVPGAPRAVACLPRSVTRARFLDSGARTDFSGISGTVRDEVRVRPGRWRLGFGFYGAKDVVVDTPALAFDSVHDVTIRPEFGQDIAVVTVLFDGEPVDACAAQAQSIGQRGGWSAQSEAGGGDGVLLALAPGTYDITGAARRRSGVRVSEAVRYVARPGARETIVLATLPCGGIRVPAHLPGNDGRLLLSLEANDVRASPCVQDTPLRLWPLWQHAEPGTWWVRPGKYTLVRRNGEERVVQRLPVVIAPSAVQDLMETDSGLALRR